MDADLPAIRARLAAASPEWRLQGCACGAGCADSAAVKAGGVLVVECAPDADATFVAHAHADVTALLAEVERLNEGLRVQADFLNRKAGGEYDRGWADGWADGLNRG